MEFRKTRTEDLNQVMALYAAARTFMQKHGNPAQWVNGYPQRELIAREIEEGNSFVCTDGEALAAVFSLISGNDPTYDRIYDGACAVKDRRLRTVFRDLSRTAF